MAESVATEGRSTIAISLVGHYVFCPRRAWLESTGERVASAQMAIGTHDHRNVDDPARSRPGELRAVEVRHDVWGVSGRLDALVETPEGVVVREYKATPVRRRAEVTEPMRTQLALQAACLESEGREVTGTEIYFTTHNRVVPVELEPADYERAAALVAATRQCVEAEHAPAPLEDDPRCMRCSHAAVCMPDEHRMRNPARRIVVGDPNAQVVHLTEYGARAHLREGRMLVDKGGERLASVPLQMIEALELHGNIDVSSGLLRELMWRNIPVMWLSGTGRLYGWAQSGYGPNGATRVEQHVASAEGRLGLAREFVGAKVANQATQLRRAGVDASVIDELRRLQRRVAVAERWQDVLGLEGDAASVYFARLPELLKPRERGRWAWHGRTGRPAGDAINALLNYGYALLTADAVRAIIACGLDPHAGFLHSSRRNKPALALDLMEEFRAPVVDSVVQTVINNHEVKPEQFDETLGSVRMRPAARKALIAAYERRMSTEFRHPIFGYSVSWRRALEIQARQVLGVLEGSQAEYRGVRVR